MDKTIYPTITLKSEFGDAKYLLYSPLEVRSDEATCNLNVEFGI